MALDGYSRTVSFLKVALPLIALGLLSTLFLLSRVAEPPPVIPFAEPEIRDRLLNQQVTGPYYTAMSADGDEITFIADIVTSPSTLDGAKRAEKVEANFVSPGGSVTDVTSEHGFFDLARDHATLTENVIVTTSQGYVMRTEHMIGKITTLYLHSPDRVTGEMPGADLEAGSMVVTAPEHGAPALLQFRDGVRLVYDPSVAGE